MRQIDTATAVGVRPTPASEATPGWFTDGAVAAGVLPTIVSADWFNSLQAEVINLLAAVGLTPDAANDSQILAAVKLAIESGAGDYWTDTGAANAYVITPSPAIAGYVLGQQFRFRAANANTGASTLNINGLGVKNIRRPDGAVLEAGDIPSGSMNDVEYDGTKFQLVSSRMAITTADISDAGAGGISVLQAASVAAARVALNIDKWTARGNANYTILSTDRAVALTAALTAPRTWTLPAAASLNAGQDITFVDAAGGVTTTNTITLVGNGGELINGGASHVVGYPHALFKLISDGVSAWSLNIEGVARGGTGATTAAGARTNLSLREQLSAARTYYVRSDGSNANTGLADSAGGAFLTLQHAVDVVNGLDFAANTVTIQARTATFAQAIQFGSSGAWIGGGQLIIQGDLGTPSNCVVAPTAAACFLVRRGVNLSGPLTIQGFKLAPVTGSGIIHSGQGSVFVGVMEYAQCTTGWQIAVDGGGYLKITGDYVISGGATFHMLAQNNSFLEDRSVNVTLTGTPAFLGAFARADYSATIYAYSNTYTGAATGQRYDVRTNAVIETSGAGATYFPGDVGGATSNGGLYL